MTRVALTMRVTPAANYSETRDSISHDWISRLVEWEMTPILIPNLGQPATALLSDFRPDVLVLTGGDDLGVTPERDVTESALLAHAISVGLPVLGVCRGLQLINVHLGGRTVSVTGHNGGSHDVVVAAPWHRLYGETANVNSFHGQGVPKDGIGDGLQITATDGDGFVEGLCHPVKPLAAVMWHPERPGAPAGDRQLLSGLAEGKMPWRRRP